MPTTTAQADELQARWHEVCGDPALRDLPYKVETNHRGQLLLSPHTTGHSWAQEDVQNLLRKHAPEGRQPPEFPITTPQGVKQPDVVWMSPDRQAMMDEAGDPPTLAPEICVEVMSSSNDWNEMLEKARLYFSLGAEEVWVVSEDRRIHFLQRVTDEEISEREASPLAPECPARLSAGDQA